jgi:hypothetical protein
MKKVIKLTESDLVRIVKRVIKENEDDSNPVEKKIPLSIKYLKNANSISNSSKILETRQI